MRELLQSRRHGKHRSEDADNQETTKAAAWAVFQHHGGSINRPTGLTCGAVRRASRFKIEAQMKQEMAHHSASAPSTDAAANNWDAGSTLFDSFELDSLCKQLGHSFHPQPVSSFDEEDEEPDYAAPMDTGTYSSSPRHGYHDDDEESEEYVKDGHRHSHFQQHASGRRKQLDLIDEVLPITFYEGPVGKDNATGRSATSHGKLLSAFTWWSMSKSRRRRSLEKKSSDDEESPKEAVHHKSKWKLSNIFHPSHHDVAHMLHSPKRIVPHEYSLEKGGHKLGRGNSPAKTIDNKSYNHPPKQEKSGYGTPRRELDYIAKDVDLPRGVDKCEPDFYDHDDDDHQQHFSHALKSGLRMVLPRSLCRPLHGFGDADSDMEDVTVYRHTQPASNKGSRQHQHHYGGHIGSLHRHQDEERQEYSETDYHHDHHHHHHHHYVHQPAEEHQDYELTVQAIVRRVPRKSFEEMMVYRRLSTEESGVKGPTSSLENFERRNSWENHPSRGS